MNIYTTSQARSNLFKIIDHTAQSHTPIYIVGKKHKAVLLSEEDYSALIETLYIKSIHGLEESVLKARQEPIESYSDKIDWNNV